MRTQLLIRWFNPEAGRRTLAITSPCAREGRSFIAANLAVVFSQLGQRTLLIDADFRAPRQQSIFNISDRFGLSWALSGPLRPVGRRAGRRPRPAWRCCRPARCRPTRSSCCRAARSRRCSPRRRSEYDVILLDTPPVTEYADAAAITFRTGDALLISRKDHTRLADTERAVRDLSDAERAHRRHADERVLVKRPKSKLLLAALALLVGAAGARRARRRVTSTTSRMNIFRQRELTMAAATPPPRRATCARRSAGYVWILAAVALVGVRRGQRRGARARRGRRVLRRAVG